MGIQDTLISISEAVGGLKADSHTLKSDIAALRTEVKGLRADVTTLKSRKRLKVDLQGVLRTVLIILAALGVGGSASGAIINALGASPPAALD